jgi:hypothetical protein
MRRAHKPTSSSPLTSTSMGTRHLIFVYYKGKYCIAQYGQWDGYPDGQGVVVLDFAQDPSNIAKLQAALDNDMIYTPTPTQLDKINEEIQTYHSEKQARLLELLRKGDGENYMKAMDRDQSNDPYPTLNRDTGAKILQLVAEAKEPVPIIREVNFIADTLFCEWAYVLDLDLRVFEVYSGRSNGSGERFKGLGGPGYIAKFSLDSLPDEKCFLKECGESVDDDDAESPDESKEDETKEEITTAT